MILNKDDLDRLVKACKQPSYTIPAGLTRQERREFIIKCARGEVKPNDITG